MDEMELMAAARWLMKKRAHTCKNKVQLWAEGKG